MDGRHEREAGAIYGNRRHTTPHFLLPICLKGSSLLGNGIKFARGIPKSAMAKGRNDPRRGPQSRRRSPVQSEQQQQHHSENHRMRDDGNSHSMSMKPDPRDVDEMMQQQHVKTLWMYFANIMLGLWLLTSPAMFDYESVPLSWSDALSGAAIVALGIVALFSRGDFWGRWGICFLGVWLWFAPLLFHAPTAFVYANDTIVGALVVSFSVLAPGIPGKAHRAVMMQPGPEIPPGWSYNPSTWGQRGPIIALAFISFLISRYMTAYQLGHIDTVWDPFFDPGTTAVLTSDVSKAFPVPDSGLGAMSYLLEGLSGFLGATNRWRTTPWMVVLFAILIVPVGVVSIMLIIMQPVIVGVWCTPCLVTGLCMLIMIPLVLDEVWATGQFLLRARREGKSLWRTFWVGGTIEGATEGDRASQRQMPHWPSLLAGMFKVKVPWTLLASTLIGFWLMASPAVFGSTGTAATSTYLVGPLVAVIAAASMIELARPVRFVNIALGLWLIAAPWLLSGATTGSTANAIVVGLAIIVLSVPRGAVRDRYGGWQPYIV